MGQVAVIYLSEHFMTILVSETPRTYEMELHNLQPLIKNGDLVGKRIQACCF